MSEYDTFVDVLPPIIADTRNSTRSGYVEYLGAAPVPTPVIPLLAGDPLDPRTSRVYLPLDGRYMESGTTRTRSLCRNGMGLTYAQLGDGSTAATMPTDLLPFRGVAFNGSQYIALGQTGELEINTFTVLALVKPGIMPTDGRLYEVGVPTSLYSLNFDSATSSIEWTSFTGGVLTSISSANGYGDGQVHVVAATISPTGMNLYVDGVVEDSVAGDYTIAAWDINSAAYFGISTALDRGFIGDMFLGSVYPFVLTSGQIREWGRRARQMRNL